MTGGLVMFFFQFVVMMGLFFVIPLYLSVALGLSAIDTGIRITPLSLTMLLAAAGIPQVLPEGLAPARGRARARGGRWSASWCCSARWTWTRARHRDRPAAADRARHGRARLAARERHRLGGARRTEPRGRRPPEHGVAVRRVARDRARRLGADRRADRLVPERDRPEPRRARVGQPPRRTWSSRRRPVRLGCPAETALQDAGVDPKTTQAIVDENEQARVDGLRSALALLAIIGMFALFFTRRIPTRQPGQVAVADAHVQPVT